MIPEWRIRPYRKPEDHLTINQRILFEQGLKEKIDVVIRDISLVDSYALDIALHDLPLYKFDALQPVPAIDALGAPLTPIHRQDLQFIALTFIEREYGFKEADKNIVVKRETVDPYKPNLIREYRVWPSHTDRYLGFMRVMEHWPPTYPEDKQEQEKHIGETGEKEDFVDNVQWWVIDLRAFISAVELQNQILGPTKRTTLPPQDLNEEQDPDEK